jgi:hypothetical protein
MRIILVDIRLQRVRHTRFCENLHLLCNKVLLHKCMHSDLMQLFLDSQIWVVNAELWFLHANFGSARLLCSVESKDVSRVGNVALEFLAQSDRIDSLRDPRRVHLRMGLVDSTDRMIETEPSA